MLQGGGNGGIIKSITVDDVNIAVHGKEIDSKVTDILAKYFTGETEGYYINGIEVRSLAAEKNGRPLMQTEARKVGNVYETHILINEDLFRGRSVEELEQKLKEQPLNLANTFEEAVIHEIGHAKTIYANRFSDIGKLYNKLEAMGVDDISKIASEDGAEAVAEIEVLKFKKENISKDAQELYNKVMNGEIKDDTFSKQK